MFDSTGILEMYCQRIATPTEDEHGHTFPSESSTKDRFVVFVFLMERFDWMGENVASVSFSLDHGPVQDVAWALRPAPENILPPKPRAADEMQFHAAASKDIADWRYHLQRSNHNQVNAHGSLLSPQEHDTSRIVITLRRGRKGITKDPQTGETRYHFIPATGAAAFPTNVVFNYDSTYRGIVHITKTVTSTQCTMPRLELTRTALEPVSRKRFREVNEESSSHGSDVDSSPPAKHSKLIDSDDSEILVQDHEEDDADYHGPLSPYWSKQA